MAVKGLTKMARQVAKNVALDDFESANNCKRVDGNFHKGVRSRFIKLKDGWGWKGCYCAEDRDQNRNTQKYLHMIGLAPAVGGKLNLKIEGDTYFGYFTEVADNLDADDEDDMLSFQYTEMNPEYRIYYNDDHIGNFGFDKNGNFVIIDCEKRCVEDTLFDWEYSKGRIGYII